MRFFKSLCILLLVNAILFGAVELASYAVLQKLGVFSQQTRIFNAQNGRDDALAVQYDEKLGYRMVQQGESGEVFKDSLGRPFSVRKAPGVYRIVCVGGSTTYGTGADKPNSFPVLLEKMLNLAAADCPIRFEVANFGMLGYHSWHSLIRVTNEFLAYAPDMVITMDAVNDLAASLGVVDSFAFEDEKAVLMLLAKQGAAQKEGAWSIIKKSSTFRLLLVLWEKSVNKVDSTSLASKIEKFGYRRNITNIIEFNTANGVRTMLANYPFLGDANGEQSQNQKIKDASSPRYLHGASYFARVNEQMAKETGALYADLRRPFEQVRQSGQSLDTYYCDEIHFTKRGNYIIAQELMNALLQSGALTHLACRIQPVEAIDPLLHPQIFFKNGLETAVEKVDLGIASTHNIAETTDESGFRVLAPASPQQEGVVVLKALSDIRLARMTHSDFGAYAFCRLGSPSDSVSISHNQRRIFTFAGVEKRWTDIGAKFGVLCPDMPAADTLTVRLAGGAQLWVRADGAALFRDDQHPGY